VSQADPWSEHDGSLSIIIDPWIIPCLCALALLASYNPWGPGTHVQLANRILEEAPSRLPSAPTSKIIEYPRHFIYGNIAADVINFKSYGGLRNHCHNWNMEERLGAHATSDQQQAFIQGYLCHLAADTVAHGHFVPFHLLNSAPPPILGHTYWEARADSPVSEENWLVLDDLRKDRTLRKEDLLIQAAVPTQALSMGTNRWIFDHVLLARSRKSWRVVIKRMRRRKPAGQIDESEHRACLDLALERMRWVFSDRHHLALRQFDPTGDKALKTARGLKRQLVLEHGSRASASKRCQRQAVRRFSAKKKRSR